MSSQFLADYEQNTNKLALVLIFSFLEYRIQKSNKQATQNTKVPSSISSQLVSFLFFLSKHEYKQTEQQECLLVDKLGNNIPKVINI
jgi:hypothetical protein